MPIAPHAKALQSSVPSPRTGEQGHTRIRRSAGRGAPQREGPDDLTVPLADEHIVLRLHLELATSDVRLCLCDRGMGPPCQKAVHLWILSIPIEKMATASIGAIGRSRSLAVSRRSGNMHATLP
ncbi:hypothetical protein E9232_000624 [Inquilinus ginsengisoli]|uniref:SWIM-type domain-containing protein n=1 Tax=Inquilinus ginsengisoli TaxID=363840 RepID=A0ABU1JHP4_9PROT|nr:hypothetical protein [Inquilinus ginsengisoli]